MAVPIESRAFGELLEQLGAKSPTPGGGAVASAVGALGAALGRMVVAYSEGKRSLAEHRDELLAAAARLEATRDLLLRLAEEDEEAYGLVNELSRLPADDARRSGLPEATLAAARVPLSCAAACVSMLRLLESLAPITNRYLRSDLAIAAILGESAARAAAWNVDVNLPGIADEPRRESLRRESESLLASAAEIAARVARACRDEGGA